MTKLVRKLKQMTKQRAHRKQVQKRKAGRIQCDLDKEKETKEKQLERETDKELARMKGEDVFETESDDDEVKAKKLNNRIVRIVGDLVLDAAPRKNKKQLSRKQAKRQEKAKEKGVAISDQIAKKFDRKKRRIKVRAQIRNEDLH